MNNKIFLSICKTIKDELDPIMGKHLKKIILYGSYARNEAVDGSDLDIMLLSDLKKEELVKYRDKISDIMVDLSLEFDLLISITENNIDDFYKFADYIPFYKNVNNEGIELYAS